MKLKLTRDEKGLCIVDSENHFKPFTIDFNNPALQYRILHNPQKEGLPKALALKPGKSLKILDATAGLGRDAFLIAALGYEVTLLERNHLLFSLLEDALARARLQENLCNIVAKMHLVQGDSIAFLQKANAGAYDVIYCDPMFPERKKSALVKKDMQIVQALVGVDTDIEDLLAIARQKARNRVVVKRPRQYQKLSARPCFSYQYPTCQYEVFLCNRLDKQNQ